jgi:hypothetical protein
VFLIFAAPFAEKKFPGDVVLFFPGLQKVEECFPDDGIGFESSHEIISVLPDELHEQFAYVFRHVFGHETSVGGVLFLFFGRITVG